MKILLHDRRRCTSPIPCRIAPLLSTALLTLLFIYATILYRRLRPFKTIRAQYNISPHVHLIDLHAPVKQNLRCIETKALLRKLSTTICLHEPKRDRFVSGAFSPSASIWEEQQVTRLLRYLTHHPHVQLIDIGANIGTYTMYAAALGRFVLAIDCFAPNLLRLRRAIQLTSLYDRVVLVHNALYNESGQSLRLAVNTINLGGQSIQPTRKHNQTPNSRFSNPYVVNTIIFDELLPILVAHGVRSAVIKMDIEGSEVFVVKTAARIFQAIDIPWVQMEWMIVRPHADQTTTIVDFFQARHYDPVDDACKALNTRDTLQWPSEIYWVKRNSSTFCSLDKD